MVERADVGHRDSRASVVRAVPPFVSRAQELRWLENTLEETTHGHPQVLFIVGEAGVGKTRLLEAFGVVAQRHGLRVCYSRCFEELILPYLPFVEMMRFLLEPPTSSADLTLGPDMELVNRFLQQPGTSLLTSTASTVTETAQDKLRLFLAVSRITARLIQDCPTVVVVDDLHWADQASLDLFNYLVLTMADLARREPIPLLMIGTYRPVEPEERLARLLGRLQREPWCQTLLLAGLDNEAMHQLLGHLGQGRPSSLLTQTIAELTQGNPLFIQEVFHHLRQQGMLHERQGYLVTTGPLPDLRFPLHLSAAMASRIQKLGAPCQRLLTLAAFLGERFTVPTLSAVSAMDEDMVLDLLEEGLQQRILVSEGAVFQFAHSMLRHAFYNMPSSVRRQRLHQQIAMTLERLYADHLDANVLEIAHHLLRAGPAAAPKMAIEYTGRAGAQAFAALAWGDAARYYEAALAAAPAAGFLATQERAELHYWAGLAYFRAQDVGPCLDHYDQASENYRRSGDLQGQARALLEKTRTLCTLAAVPYGTLTEVQWLEDRLPALSQTAPGLGGRIAAELSLAYWMARQTDRAQAMAQFALEVGKHLADDRLCARAGFVQALAHIQNLHVREALESYQYALSVAQRVDDIWLQGQPLQRMPQALMLLGRLDEAEAVALKAANLARQAQDWADYSVVLSVLASVALARGDFAMAERRTDETMRMVARSSHYPWGGFRALSALACTYALRGAWSEATAVLDRLIEPGHVFQTPGAIIQVFVSILRQLLQAQAQGRIEVPLESLTAELLRPGVVDTYALAPLCALVEIADLLGLSPVPEPLVQALQQTTEHELLFSTGWVCLFPRVLGVAAMLNRQWDAAEAYLQTALAVATRVGARPEQGRSALDYARLLVARGGASDRQRAVALVQQATRLFRALEMEPYIWRAEQLAATLYAPVALGVLPRARSGMQLSAREVGILRYIAQGRRGRDIAAALTLPPESLARQVQRLFARIGVTNRAAATAYAREHGLVTPHATPGRRARGGQRSRTAGARTLHIILVTDIAGSSAIIEHLGDARAYELLCIHNTIIRTCLRRHHGAEVTHTGDGIEASFASAARAVACAIAIQRAFARHNRGPAIYPLRVRIGINAGEPIPTEGRLFGTAVHTTFYLCSQAQPEQILTAEVIPQLATGKRFSYIDRGPLTLKGSVKQMRVYEVQWKKQPASF